MEIVNAAAHLEQVERIVGKLLGGDAGGERPKILRVALHCRDARGDRRPRVRIVEDQLDQRRKTQAQAFVVGLGEFAAQGLVEQERSFEVGAGGGPLDPAHALAQVQLAGLSIDGAEQALQAAAQVRGLADVRLAGLVLAAQQKHRRTRRSSGEQLGVAVGDELDALGSTDIVSTTETRRAQRNQCRNQRCHPERAPPRRASRRSPIPAYFLDGIGVLRLRLPKSGQAALSMAPA